MGVGWGGCALSFCFELLVCYVFCVYVYCFCLSFFIKILSCVVISSILLIVNESLNLLFVLINIYIYIYVCIYVYILYIYIYYIYIYMYVHMYIYYIYIYIIYIYIYIIYIYIIYIYIYIYLCIYIYIFNICIQSEYRKIRTHTVRLSSFQPQLPTRRNIYTCTKDNEISYNRTVTNYSKRRENH